MSEDPTPAVRRDLFSWIVAIALVLVAIGTPLLGTKSLLGGDVVLRSAPWNQTWTGSETYIPIGDTIDNLGPARHQAAQRLRNGDVPKWDPLPAGGSELGAVPSFSVASPLNLPYLVLPSRIAPAYAKLLELILVLVGSVLLLRRLGASTAAGLFAGVAFAFSGFQVVWTNWPHTQTAALAPLLFWAAERAFQERRLIDVVPVALALGTMLAGGFPAVAMHFIYALIFYLMIRSVAALATNGATVSQLLKAAGLIGAGMLLGVALIGAQLGPFLDQIDERDLSYRQGYGTRPLPSKLLVTAAIPNAYGSAGHDQYYGPSNPMEALAFAGTSTLFLVGLGLILVRRNRYPAGATVALAVLAVFLTLALFFGSAPLSALNKLPTMSSNAIGRMRGLWGFIIAMAGGLGLQAVLDNAPSTSNASLRNDSTKTAHRILVPFYCLATVTLTLIVGSRLANTSRAEGGSEYVVLGVVVALGALASTIGMWFGRNKLRQYLGPFAVLILSVEILFFVIPFWPRIETERVIPETPTHAYLQQNMGSGRVVNDGRTLYTGTTGYFGLRTVTGHIFHDDSWKQMLVAADPNAFNLSPTFSFINLSNEGHLQSPALDRLRTSHAVVTLEARVFGTYIEDNWDPVRTQSIRDKSLTNIMPSQPIRGVVVVAALPADFSQDEVAGIKVRISAGDQVVESTRRLFSPVPIGGIQIAVAGEDLPTTGEMTIEVSTYGRDDEMTFLSNTEGEVGVGIFVPADDGLRLAFADGASVYERLNALPRFHFASESLVVPSARDRVEILSKPLDPNIVVLSGPSKSGNAGSGASGKVVSVDESDPDVMKVDVQADGAGWLVIGDALQGGWTATINGQPTDLVDADHAVAAVEVPAGRHQVELRYSPERGSEGFLASVVSLLTLFGLAAWRYRGYFYRRGKQ